MSLAKDFFLSVTLLLCHGACAEVFKCLDENGSITYRGTSCAVDEQAASIDKRFSNTLPMNFSDEDAEVISKLSAQTKRRRTQRVEAQDKLFTERIEAFRHKEESCKLAREDYDQMLVNVRRGNDVTQRERKQTVKRMRDACSG